MESLNINLRSATKGSRTTSDPWWVALCFVVASIIGIWPALTNGQPFFFPDTTAYVRGADLAVANVLGDRFATDWAKDSRRVLESNSGKTGLESPQPEQKSVPRPVLASRSIVYGVLLYLGARTGQMWLSIVVQSFIAVYLTYLFTRRTLGLTLWAFLIACGVLSLASSLPFYVSLLMPDVFAGFLILAFAILATTWERLSNHERALTSVILLFAVLSHTTHVILLAVLTALTVAYVWFLRRLKWVHVRPVLAVGTACVVAAFVWEAAFGFVVKRTLGAAPLRPPFLTAKLVALLGEPPVAKLCASNDFAVCRFQDRLPMDSDSFLWSENTRTGVFSVVDLQTKQALGNEQWRFAMAVIPANFGRLASGIFRDGLRQLISTGLDEFSYANAMAFFRDRLPRRDLASMASTVAAKSRVYVVFGNLVSYVTTAIGVVLLAGLFRDTLRSKDTRESLTDPENIWRAAAWILVIGIVLNAFVCGGLSSVNDRYEARVIWLMPLSLATGLLVMRRESMTSPIGIPALEKSVTVFTPESL